MKLIKKLPFFILTALTLVVEPLLCNIQQFPETIVCSDENDGYEFVDQEDKLKPHSSDVTVTI